MKKNATMQALSTTTIANKETAKTQIDAHAPSIGVNGPTSYDIGGGISVENDKNDKRTVHVANLSIAMNQDALVQLTCRT